MKGKILRIDKFLTKLELGSRSQVKDIIKEGRIMVNGEVICKPEYHIDEDNDNILLDKKMLIYNRFYYYMLNKPKGVVSAVTDTHCRTVLDLIDVTPKKGLFPVGRLDKDTEGLMIITNDGQLAHDLLSPGKHVEKTYYVELDGDLSADDIKLFKSGLDIGEKALTKPAILNIYNEKNKALITITEGKYHQIKRMFNTIGLTVTYLKRISMGNLKLDENLSVGEYRMLTCEEIKLLNERNDSCRK